MMITSTETSSSVIPPTAPPMMGMGTSISEVDNMTTATSSMVYVMFIVIELLAKVCTNCVTSSWSHPMYEVT